MIYSFTQISQYMSCPRQYRYKYLEGWQQKDTRAAMLFGRCFENALQAYFRDDDSAAVFFKEWDRHRDTALVYSKNESWDKLYHQGIRLLERFAQDDCVKIYNPHENLQVKVLRQLSQGNQFVSFVDAIGEVNSTRCIIDWKTTTSRYIEEPVGILSLDPQLVCYSWMSGIRNVALVVFVRKTLPEIQYLTTSITDEQCEEYGELVGGTVSQIESGTFAPHSGIRFPHNACVSCSHLGLCLGNQHLIDSHLIRKPGAADLDWLDQLDD
jgi:PD-(D/E)XK nuclease superfamily